MLDKFAKKESPMKGMMGLGGGVPSRLLTLASGEITYVDDVFSTYLHKGENSSSTINNGIDLSGEGGLVWVKSRTTTYNHWAFDTERGATKQITISQNYPEATEAKSVTAFNSNGFDIGGTGGDCGYNCSGHDFVYWTFRKCPGFFDIVTWTTTTNSAEQIPHNLGSVPGMIIVKRTDAESNWLIWHRSLSNPLNDFLRFDGADKQSAVGVWGNNAPNSTHFEYDSGASGRTFVAYVFAHNDGSFGESRNEAVIKCGSYTGTGSANITETLGFEPQWLLVKNISTSNQDWTLVDTMRGFTVGTVDERLDPNNNTAGESSFNVFEPTPRGFRLGSSVLDETNKTSDTHIYIAIARPHKPPEAGTDVFLASTTGTNTTINTGFNVDWAIVQGRGGTDQVAGTRLLGSSRFLEFNKADNQSSSSAMHKFDNSNSFVQAAVNTNPITWMFGRAAKVFDVVTYKGTGSSGLVVNHNLKTTPELLIFKNRTSSSTNWFIVNADESGNWNTGGAALNPQSFITFGSSSFTINTTGTSSNASGQEYVGYLFASYAGISKVGTYTGSSGDVNVDCGFTNGARFVLIKHYDRSTGWFVLDTVRGIVSGNDPFVYWGTQTAESSSYDIVDPYSAGFTVPSGAPLGVNENGQTFLFLAIA